MQNQCSSHSHATFYNCLIDLNLPSWREWNDFVHFFFHRSSGCQRIGWQSVNTRASAATQLQLVSHRAFEANLRSSIGLSFCSGPGRDWWKNLVPYNQFIYDYLTQCHKILFVYLWNLAANKTRAHQTNLKCECVVRSFGTFQGQIICIQWRGFSKAECGKWTFSK